MTEVSVILPTYQEALNLPAICRALHETLKDRKYQILIMDDDSCDGSDDVIAQLQQQGIAVEIQVRGGTRSLSAAVINGLAQARGDYLVVMDADLSHPPQVIPQMLELLQRRVADFCLGSRYADGGSLSQHWNLYRRLNSLIATWLAYFLAPVQDPMSGFFALRRADLPPLHRLSPVGYKIALELMVKGKFQSIREIPIHFAERQQGYSKMNWRVQFFYLRHLRRLYTYRFPVLSELMQFMFVGGSGFIIDVACYLALQSWLGVNHMLARGLSFWVAGSWNWWWNRTLTFAEYAKSQRLRQWGIFLAVSLCGFAVNWGSYALLTHELAFFDRFRLLALGIGVVLGMGFNFMFSRLLVFRKIQVEVFGDGDSKT